jgi:hypothetical protein
MHVWRGSCYLDKAVVGWTKNSQLPTCSLKMPGIFARFFCPVFCVTTCSLRDCVLLSLAHPYSLLFTVTHGMVLALATCVVKIGACMPCEVSLAWYAAALSWSSAALQMH